MTRIGFLTYVLLVMALAAATADAAVYPALDDPNDRPKLDMPTWRDAEAGVDYVEDELIVIYEPELFTVQFDDPGALSDTEIAALNAELRDLSTTFASDHGLVFLDTSPVAHAALFRAPRPPAADAGARMRQVLTRLARDDDRIRFIEPNSYTRISTTEPWSDPKFVDQYWHYAVVGGQRGWDTLPVDYHVRVAVVDTGFRYGHPDAHPGMNEADDFDFVRHNLFNTCSGGFLSTDMDTFGPDDNATDEYLLTQSPAGCFQALGDTTSHGTHVAGVIASEWDNGMGGAGMVGRIEDVSTGVFEIIAVRAFDVRGTASRWDASQGIYYAAGLAASNGAGGTVSMTRADIINLSFNTTILSVVEMLAIASAFGQGSLLIASAGNGGAAANPGAWQFPAAFGQVMAVSNMALDSSGSGTFVLDPSSSAYPGVELTAPGSQITAISYDYSGCTVIVGLPCNASFGGVATASVETGTSVAAPHVTGIAALYLAHRPTSTMTDLRTMLRDSAIDLGAPGVDDAFGLGLVQTAPGSSGVRLVYPKNWGTALLVDALTGAVVDTTPIDQTGSFTFYGADAGDYYILGAGDEDGDGILGETGEAVGALNEELQFASVHTHAAYGNLVGNFPESNLRWPGAEPENLNGQMSGAGNLFVGFYAESSYAFVGDIDFFRIQVPSEGTYRIWTEGRNTNLCQENAFEYDSVIELFDENGTSIASNTDGPLNEAIELWHTADQLINGCSEIVEVLSAGTYYVSVTAEDVATAAEDAKVILRFDPM